MALVPSPFSHSGRSSGSTSPAGTSAVTHARIPPNTSDNEYFGDVVRQALSRRSSSRGGDSRTGRQQRLCARGLQQRIQGRRSTSIFGVAAPPPGMNFTAIAPNKKDAVVVPEVTGRR